MKTLWTLSKRSSEKNEDPLFNCIELAPFLNRLMENTKNFQFTLENTYIIELLGKLQVIGCNNLNATCKQFYSIDIGGINYTTRFCEYFFVFCFLYTHKKQLIYDIHIYTLVLTFFKLSIFYHIFRIISYNLFHCHVTSIKFLGI
jgi:hypothetical protein